MTREYKLNQQLTDVELVDYVWSSYQESSSWKQDAIDNKVTTWKAAYDKKPYGGENPNRSMIVDDSVRNYVHTVQTHMLQPFIETNDLVRFTSNKKDEAVVNQAKVTQDLLNYQITKNTDKFNKLDEAVKLFVGEGFAPSKIYWDHRSKELVAQSLIEGYEEAIYKDIPIEDFEQLTIAHFAKEEKPVDVKVNEEDETVNATFIYVDLISEKPNFVNVPISNLFWNPTATNISYIQHDCTYIIEKKIQSNSELRNKLRNDKTYKDFTETEIDQLFKSSKSNYEMESSLESYREAELKLWEQYKKIKSDDKVGVANQIVFEFHGWVDINGDGEDELIHCEILGNTVIKLELNQYLNDMIPYNIALFDKIPFTVNTTSIPEALLDVQKTRTSIMRNFIDSLAFGMNQNYIFEEGVMTPQMKKSFENRSPGQYFEVRQGKGGDLRNKILTVDSDTIRNDSFNVYQILEQQAQENTGITAYTQGLDSASLNQTATGVSIITQNSQKKMLKYVLTFIDTFMKPTINAYLIMNKMYLSETTFVNTQDELVTISKDDIDVDSDIDVNVSIKGFDSEKIQQINQFMQMAAPLVEAGAVPPETLTELVKEQADIWEFNKVAKVLDGHDATQAKQEMLIQEQQMNMDQPIDPGQQVI